MRGSRELKRSVVRLILALLGVGVFFVPLSLLPFGVTLSAFDLLSGALSGGAWRPARIGLLVIFASAVVFFVTSVSQVLRAKHESVA
jgi:hypothetical protein